MTKRYWLLAAVPAVFFAGVSFAQFPILDMIAGKVVEKYQQSSCEQLWVKKGEPKSPQVQEAVARLRACLLYTSNLSIHSLVGWCGECVPPGT